MIEAVIFDLDGVIVDTAKYHYFAWKRLAYELGFEFSEIHNEKLKGVSRMESLEILLSVGNITHLTELEKIELAEKKNRWYVQYIENITPDEILPGIIPLLKFLNDFSIKVAVGSASKNARKILKNIALIDEFDTIVDGNRITRAKPDPQVFTIAANDMNVPYNKCVVIEDAVAGVEAAINAGMKCVGLGDAKVLNKAHIIVNNLTQLNYQELIHLCNESLTQ